MSPTLCQCCGKYPATIHFTEIKSDKKRTLHICEACANEQGIASGAPVPSGLANLMSSAIRQAGGGSTLRCPHCGIAFEEFRTKGRFGCPRDYEVFAERLNPLLDKIHGAHRHTGRLPRGRVTVETEWADRLLALRRELQDAVRTESYEDAARIRDAIRELEQGPQAAASGPAHGDEPSGGTR